MRERDRERGGERQRDIEREWLKGKREIIRDKHTNRRT